MTNTRSALALCLLGAAGCTETWAVLEDGGEAPVDVRVVVDRGAPPDAPRPAD
ncbi:MAG: hypothetical protein JWM10_192, partial [Myxococcaceae bacterium]|nr:hypothetical protein [Myxococcaceae bacterium]